MNTSNHTAPTPRKALSPNRVVEEAMALAEESGLGAVTIRGVARRLGVTPMALYWHFRNKDDLLDGMVTWVYGAMDIHVDADLPWQDQLRSLIEAEIAVLRGYPETAMLLMSRGSISSEALAVVETALAILNCAGFSAVEATQVMEHAEQMIVSLVIRERGIKPRANAEEVERQAETVLRSLPHERYPHVIAAAEPLSRCADPDAHYAFGVELLMAGIEAMAARKA